MQAIKIRAHVGSDGVLNLAVPIGMYNQDVETVIVVQSVMPAGGAVNANGYPIDFWEQIDIIQADDLIERPENNRFYQELKQ